jgi:hypothetical protein
MLGKKWAVLGGMAFSMLNPGTSMAYDAEDISINGFGSVVAGKTLDSQESIYGYDDNLSFQEESRFAVQISAPIGEKFSATAQIMAKGADSFDPQFEWAYVSYQANDNLIVMAGRQRLNIYKYSDYVDVGYAYHWIRPPQGVYSLPFNSGNGIGFLYNRSFDEVEMSVNYKALADEINDYVPSGTEGVQPARFNIELSHVVNVDFTWEAFNFGMNYVVVPELTYEATEIASLEALLLSPSLAGLSSTALTAEETEAVMSEIRVDDEKVSFTSAYLGYDVGDWFVLAEYTDYQFDKANAFAEQESLYLSAGIRVDEYTFHASYGRDDNDPSSNIDQTIADPALAAYVKQAISAQQEDSAFYSIGARWDVEGGVALKLDYTSYDDDLNNNSDADVISMGIDFVY